MAIFWCLIFGKFDCASANCSNYDENDPVIAKNQVQICPLENSPSTWNHESKSCCNLQQLFYGKISFIVWIPDFFRNKLVIFCSQAICQQQIGQTWHLFCHLRGLMDCCCCCGVRKAGMSMLLFNGKNRYGSHAYSGYDGHGKCWTVWN